MEVHHRARRESHGAGRMGEGRDRVARRAEEAVGRGHPGCNRSRFEESREPLGAVALGARRGDDAGVIPIAKGHAGTIEVTLVRPPQGALVPVSGPTPKTIRFASSKAPVWAGTSSHRT